MAETFDPCKYTPSDQEMFDHGKKLGPAFADGLVDKVTRAFHEEGETIAKKALEKCKDSKNKDQCVDDAQMQMAIDLNVGISCTDKKDKFLRVSGNKVTVDEDIYTGDMSAMSALETLQLAKTKDKTVPGVLEYVLDETNTSLQQNLTNDKMRKAFKDYFTRFQKQLDLMDFEVTADGQVKHLKHAGKHHGK